MYISDFTKNNYFKSPINTHHPSFDSHFVCLTVSSDQSLGLKYLGNPSLAIAALVQNTK